MGLAVQLVRARATAIDIECKGREENCREENCRGKCRMILRSRKHHSFFRVLQTEDQDFQKNKNNKLYLPKRIPEPLTVD